MAPVVKRAAHRLVSIFKTDGTCQQWGRHLSKTDDPYQPMGWRLSPRAATHFSKMAAPINRRVMPVNKRAASVGKKGSAHQRHPSAIGAAPIGETGGTYRREGNTEVKRSAPAIYIESETYQKVIRRNAISFIGMGGTFQEQGGT